MSEAAAQMGSSAPLTDEDLQRVMRWFESEFFGRMASIEKRLNELSSQDSSKPEEWAVPLWSEHPESPPVSPKELQHDLPTGRPRVRTSSSISVKLPRVVNFATLADAPATAAEESEASDHSSNARQKVSVLSEEISPGAEEPSPAADDITRQHHTSSLGSLGAHFEPYVGEIVCLKRSEEAPMDFNPNRRKGLPGALDPLQEEHQRHRRELAEDLAERTSGRSLVLDWVWNNLENPETSQTALVYSRVTTLIILASVIIEFIQTSHDLPNRTSWSYVEIAFEALFAIELILRFIVSPSRWRFATTIYNYIDLFTVLPLALRAATGWVLYRDDQRNFITWLLTCVVPIVRCLKLLRRFETFELLVDAFQNVLEGFPMLTLLYFLIAFSLACLMTIFNPPDQMLVLPLNIYWAVLCMHSPGFSPVTTVSIRTLIALTCVSGMLMSALPAGVLGSAFTLSWQDRHKVLLVRRVQQRLKEFGFQPEDALKFFEYCDLDDDGELKISDFLVLVQEMRLGLSEARAVQLFHNLDETKSNSITEKEFIRHIYPNMYDHFFSGAPKPRSSWLMELVNRTSSRSISGSY